MNGYGIEARQGKARPAGPGGWHARTHALDDLVRGVEAEELFIGGQALEVVLPRQAVHHVGLLVAVEGGRGGGCWGGGCVVVVEGREEGRRPNHRCTPLGG